MKARPFFFVLLIFLLMANAAVCANANDDSVEPPPNGISASFLPFVMYDSDIGIGIGAKAVLVNKIKRRSFDFTVFGSTKGEQWYAFMFSDPFYETRQGTRYPLAFDLKIEYDKLLKSNFFGIGNRTLDNKYQFPREYFKIEPSISHALSERLVTSLNLRIAHYSVYDYVLSWNTLSPNSAGAGENDISAVGIALRFDSRDSWINPHKGIKAELTLEQSVEILGFDWHFNRARLELNAYQPIFGAGDVLAVRWWSQQIWGDCPYQELSKIGDGWTARGFKADRFLDNAMTLTSIEYRFPIYKKLGGVVFGDAGRVWPSLSDFSFRSWHADGGGGLRYYMANFVARLDIGSSVEGTRIFFNFGQVF